MAQKKSAGNGKTNTGDSRRRTTGAGKGRTQSPHTNGQTAPQKSEGSHYEIVLIVACAGAIFLEISNFGVCGSVGNAISGFLFGVFGWIQYILPIGVFVGRFCLQTAFPPRRSRKWSMQGYCAWIYLCWRS